MKQHWELDELIEHWTLLPGELTLLSRKSDTNRLGVAVLLKYFQHEAQFPLSPDDIPSVIVDYIASQVGVPARKFLKYRWDERSMQRHRTEIREFLGIRKATVQDAQEMTDWLIKHVLPQEMNVVHLKVEVEKRFQALKVEPPTPGRVERIIHSAIRTYETQFFEATLNKLSDNSRTQIDALLKTSETAEDDSAIKPSLFHTLNSEPGRVSLNSFLDEIAKLDRLRQVALPDDLFKQTSPKVLQTYATRAATEPPRELRGHPEPIRYTLVAAFCWLRTQVVTDNLVDLLIQMIHGIGSRAERRVEAQLMKEFKRVSGKYNLLYRIANASLEEPDGIVKDVIYPVVDEQTLKDLVKE
ncbi:MAG: DUF4158 domain-containing protein, partial [Leptolyngbyaceae cyanobacterium MO_188.B28]|nr:DUF4158 domain-containing protein [Leptolyngbyaceae cyanobacterium MO_188.B28]